tara:strand:+ start:447 stop:641 length:195 start_codon:yes stop_codon:yes gene_type:complete
MRIKLVKCNYHAHNTVYGSAVNLHFPKLHSPPQLTFSQSSSKSQDTVSHRRGSGAGAGGVQTLL